MVRFQQEGTSPAMTVGSTINKSAFDDVPRNSLAGGFYTVNEAARLIDDGSASRIRGWFRGFPKRKTTPLLVPDYDAGGGKQELSFLDLIETRFVEHFRRHEVKPRTLRVAQEALRNRFKVRHPFATGKIIFEADKADVFIHEMRQAAEAEHDVALLSLTTDNFVLREVVKQNLVPGLEFDAEQKYAREWKPRPDRFPTVSVDPRVAYGQPSLPSGQATGLIYSSWKAQKEDIDAVAYWTGMKVHDIQIAVEFERLLDCGTKH